MTLFNKPGAVGKLDADLDKQTPEPAATSIVYYGPPKVEGGPLVDITNKMAIDKILKDSEETWKATVVPNHPDIIADNPLVNWPKFGFDLPLIRQGQQDGIDGVIPVPGFMNIPEGGFKRGELAILTAMHPGYLMERKSNLAVHMALTHAQKNPGVRLHMNLEHDADFDSRAFAESLSNLDITMTMPMPSLVGRGLTNAVLHMEPGVTLADINQYNEERLSGKMPSKFPESDYFGVPQYQGSEVRTAKPKKNKAKKPGKRKARISPLMKNLLKGVT